MIYFSTRGQFMKKGLLFITLLASLGLASCNNNDGGSQGGGSGTYTLTALETEAVNFLSLRGVTVDKLEPIHMVKDSDVIFVDTEPDFYEEDGDTYYPYYYAAINNDYVQDILNSMKALNWTVPATEGEYGYECLSPDQKIEIDVLYVPEFEGDPEGTDITIYSYNDLTGGGEVPPSTDDVIDIGDALTVTMSELGFADKDPALALTGTKMSVVFVDGTTTNTTYYTNGNAIRIYGGGGFYVYSDFDIVKVEFTWGNSKAPSTTDCTVDPGTYDYGTATGVWTGNAKLITFTNTASSGHWRLQAITVTLAA